MAWDKTLPANNTKIRTYPTVLTANFGAVEEGQDSLKYWKANFIERNAIPSAPAVTPTRVDDTMQVFSKQNPTTSETDLFVLDDRSTANTIQLTEDGQLGGISQALACDTINFTGNRTFNEANMVAAWGYVASGSLSFGSGVSNVTSTTIAGFTFYSVTLSAGTVNSANYSVMVTPTASNRACYQYTTVAWTTTRFDVSFTSVTTGDSTTSDFHFLVVGGQ